MAEATAYSQDLSLMNNLYYNQDVLTKEYCLQQDDVQLQALFQKKIEEAKIAFENSQLLLKGENTSVPYSECIVVAEQACLSAKNVKEVLAARNLLSTAQCTSFSQLEKELESTRQLQPLGKTTLQLKDIELVKQMSVIPTNDVYTSDLGIVYYQPKVSHMNVRPFFEAYCKTGGYKSVQTSTKNNQCFYNVDFKANFHLVSLMKTKEQAVYALEQLQGNTSDISIVESRFTDQSRNGFFDGLLTAGAQMFPSIKWTGEQEVIPNMREKSEMKEVILKQKSILADIKIHLSRVIIEEKWIFEDFKILSAEEQIQLGVPATEAVMADCILLFHKKAEDRDQK